jgi:hypothetical protein
VNSGPQEDKIGFALNPIDWHGSPFSGSPIDVSSADGNCLRLNSNGLNPCRFLGGDQITDGV